MKKIFLFLLFSCILNCHNAIYAQSMSIEETKKMLCSNKWFLRRFEKDGKMFTVPKEVQGTKMVFYSNGTAYSFLPSEKESDGFIGNWSITKTQLTMLDKPITTVYKYRLEDFIGYKLYLTETGEDDAPTFVFEQAEKNETVTKSIDEKTNPVFSFESELGDSLLIARAKNNKLKTAGNERSFINQQNSRSKETIIKELNSNMQETIGNIKYWSKNQKQQIVNTSFSASGGSVKIETTFAEAGEPNSTFSYEFNPLDIKSKAIYSMPEESPVGHLTVKFDGSSVLIKKYDKKEGLRTSYEDYASLSYLRVDPKSIDKIISALDELKELYKKEADNSTLMPLIYLLEDRKFWFSVDGTSKTYTLGGFNFSDCSIRLTYYLESISTSEDVKQFYMTEIPLADINDIRLETGKSKPNCIMLEARKSGFETYVLKNKIFIPAKSVSEIPLFIDVSGNNKKEKVIEMLKKLVKDCGGGKISL